MVLFALAGCSNSGRVLRVPSPTRTPPVIRSVGAFDFSSPSITAVGELPLRVGRSYDNVAPALEWGSLPARSKYLVLVADIPKADFGTSNEQVLWLVANIDPALGGFAEAAAPPGEVVKPWSGPDTAVGARDTVRFRMWAVSTPLKSTGLTPLQIVLLLDKDNVGKAEFSAPFAPKGS